MPCPTCKSNVVEVYRRWSCGDGCCGDSERFTRELDPLENLYNSYEIITETRVNSLNITTQEPDEITCKKCGKEYIFDEWLEEHKKSFIKLHY